MLTVRLFLVFLKIGVFTFGGGYAMVALIQSEVVERHGWLSAQEFADILAVSQMTPGPFGINVATYTGYAAVVDAGYGSLAGVVGAVVCSLAVIALPYMLMMLVLRVFKRYKGSELMQTVMSLVRLVVVGLVASAALLLVGGECFGTVGCNRRFVVSVAIFLAVFVLTVWQGEWRVGTRRFSSPSPILLMVLAGIVGWLAF